MEQPYNKTMWEMDGETVRQFVLEAMRHADASAFRRWFRVLGRNPDLCDDAGVTLWMSWCRIRERIPKAQEAGRAAIDAVFEEAHCYDCRLLQELYARGGVPALLLVAKAMRINARDEDGLRVLDRIVLPTHLGKLYGESLRQCSEEDVRRLREAGFRFGYADRGYDTLRCRAPVSEAEEKAPYFDECLKDAREIVSDDAVSVPILEYKTAVKNKDGKTESRICRRLMATLFDNAYPGEPKRHLAADARATEFTDYVKGNAPFVIYAGCTLRDMAQPGFVLMSDEEWHRAFSER